MQTTVKRWFTDKGYGFLHNGGDAPDIMVHANELKNCQYLRPGRTVEFECHINSKGLMAKTSDWFKTSLKPESVNNSV